MADLQDSGMTEEGLVVMDEAEISAQEALAAIQQGRVFRKLNPGKGHCAREIGIRASAVAASRRSVHEFGATAGTLVQPERTGHGRRVGTAPADPRITCTRAEGTRVSKSR